MTMRILILVLGINFNLLPPTVPKINCLDRQTKKRNSLKDSIFYFEVRYTKINYLCRYAVKTFYIVSVGCNLWLKKCLNIDHSSSLEIQRKISTYTITNLIHI